MHRPATTPAPELADDLTVVAVTLDEAGRRLSVSGATVRRLIGRGEIRSVTLLGARRVPVSELTAFLARRLAAEHDGGGASVGVSVGATEGGTTAHVA